ncbi:MAG: RidA family protein [Bacteroidia bacterium]|nr:RidA family protein [Bacteroidia bacterium]
MKNTLFWITALAAVALLVYLNFFKKDASDPDPGIIFSADAPKPIGPYSQAVSRGNAVFVSGQIAMDPKTGKMDTADIGRETERVLTNIRAVLSSVKLEMKNVVKCTVFMTDLQDFKAMNATYAKFFSSNPPARETVQVSGLPAGAHVEISVIAIR